jgi:membrane associated rhomboid family serine protease
VLATYGGLLMGVLPTNSGVSWEAHLCGFLAGVLSARVLARRKKKRTPAV